MASSGTGGRLPGAAAALALLGACLLVPVAVLPRPARAVPPAAPRVLFDATDPRGDDRGPGGYVYPTHRGFAPHYGLLDLLRFRVLAEGGEVLFQFRFARVTNPWDAPEGFFHQRIDVYVDTRPGGRTEPYGRGARVRFAPGDGWEYGLRVAPFGHSQLVAARGPSAVVWPVAARLLADGQTIEARVPRDRFAEDLSRARFTVLVGGYDLFGPDLYRPVRRRPGPWHFGGARDPDRAPYVIDLLAPPVGPGAQRFLLSGYRRLPGGHAQVRPAPPNLAGLPPGTPWVAVAAGAIGTLGLVGHARRRIRG